MNDEHRPDTPENTGVWVPKDEYDTYKIRQAADVKKAKWQDALSKKFYIMLAIGGAMVAIAFIGGLIIPAHPTGNRSCMGSWFDNVAPLLYLVGYLLLMATGIFGATISRTSIRSLGIVLIVLVPIASVITLFIGFFAALCGV